MQTQNQENRHDRKPGAALLARGLDPATEPDRTTLPLLHSIRDVMRLLGISYTTVWRLTRNGKLTARKIGRKNYYRADEIRAFVETLTSVETKEAP